MKEDFKAWLESKDYDEPFRTRTATHCPIATFVKETVEGAEGVCVITRDLLYLKDDVEVSVQLPSWATQFIILVDNNAYSITASQCLHILEYEV